MGVRRGRGTSWLGRAAALLMGLAAASPCTGAEWVRSLGGPRAEYIGAGASTRDGGVALAVASRSFGRGGYEVWVVKLDADGGVTWQVAIGGPLDETPDAIAEGADGSIWLLASISDFGLTGDNWLIRLAPDGSLLQQTAFEGSESGTPSPLVPTQDGGVIFCGSAGFGNSDIVKVDATGAVEWQERVREAVTDVAQAPDGGYFVLGSTYRMGAGLEDAWIAKLDAAGQIVWARTVGSSADEFGALTCAVADGGVLITVMTAGAPTFVKLDAAGALSWQFTLTNPVLNGIGSVVAMPDGTFLAAGTGASPDRDGWLMGIDAGGVPTFLSTIVTQGSNTLLGADPTPDGGIVRWGSSATRTAGLDVWVVKGDRNGLVGGACALGALEAPVATATSLVAGTANVSPSAVTLTPTVTSATVTPTTCEEETWCAVDGCVADAFERDDDCGGLVQRLADPAVQQHSFCDDSEDWYRLDACAGTSYMLETSALGAMADTVIEIFADDCRTLLASDDNGGGGLASRLVYPVTADMPLVLRVRQADGGTGAGRDYVLSVTPDSERCTTWLRAYGTRANESVRDVVVMPDGTMMAVGGINVRDSDLDAWVVRLSSSGSVLWQRAIGGPARDIALTAAVLETGDVLVAGTTESFGAGGQDAWLLAFRPDGSIAWQETLGDTAADDLSRAESLAGGGALLCGSTASGGGTDGWVVQVDAAGGVTWDARVGDASGELLYAVIPLPDGSAWLAGVHGGDASLLRLDPSHAVAQSVAVNCLGTESAADAAVTSDGGIALAGYSVWTFSTGAMVLKLDAAGNLAWQLGWSDVGSNYLRGIVADTAGGVTVSGTTSLVLGTGTQGWLMSLDAAGSLTWGRALGGENDEGLSPRLRRTAGGLLAAGWTGNSLNGDGWVVATDALGRVTGACPESSDFSVAGTPISCTVTTTSLSSVPTGLVPVPTTAVAVPSGALETRSCAGSPFMAAPPSEVSPAGAAQLLVFTSRTTLVWDAAGASGSDVFNLYRGRVAELRSATSGACLFSGITSSTADDPAVPVADAWFYLVAGENAAGEGPLGFSSRGALHAPAVSCP